MKKFYFIIIAIFSLNIANAQWQPVPINYNYRINSLTTDSNKILMSTIAGVFLSTNYGSNWAIVDSSTTSKYFRGIVFKGDSIFANSAYGVFLSTNSASGWTAMNTGLTNIDVRALEINGNKLYAATVSGEIFSSTNNASSWTNMNTSFVNTYISDLLINGNNIYAATNRGVYLTTNNGTSWNQLNIGLTDTNVTRLTKSGNNILAGTYSGNIYSSSNNGSNWNLVLAQFSTLGGWNTSSFATISDTVYAAIMFRGVYRSTDNGNTWLFSNYGMLDSVNCLTVCGNNVFAGTLQGLCRHSFADFSAKYTITTSSSPLAGGTTTGDGLYTIYHPCTVKAVPNQGYTFSNWSINTPPYYNWYSDTVYTFDVVENWNIIANFNILALSAGTILGDTLFCAPVNNKAYHVPPIAGVNSDSTGYEWHYTGNGASLVRSITGDTVYISFSQYIYPGILTVRGRSSLGHGPWSQGCHINSLTVPNGISYSGNTPFCVPDTVTLNINSNPYTSYLWNFSPVSGLTVLNTTLTSCSLYIDTIAPNNINIGISSSNMCGTGSNSINLTPQKLPLSPGTITGLTSVYAGQQSLYYSVPQSASINGYIWAVPIGATGYGTSNHLLVNYNSSAVSGNITVKGFNTCGAGPSSSLYVNVSPVVPNCSAQFALVADTNVLHHYFVVNNALGVQPLHYVWNWGDGTQDTIAYPSHTYSIAGYYNICLTITDSVGCTNSYCDFSYLQKSPNAIISVSVIPQGTLGINEITKSENIKIYPNPAKDNITIETNSNIKQDLEILNLLGQMVYASSINLKSTINVSSFPKGVYFIRINTNKGTLVKKFVKE